jgi:hypothetical protein
MILIKKEYVKEKTASSWFPIHFVYLGKDYTADVQKVESVLAEYHISGITPAIDHIPDPFVIAEHFSKEKFDFPVNEMYYPASFGHNVLKAISRDYKPRR